MPPRKNGRTIKDIGFETIGAPTYDNLKDFVDTVQSSGRISGGVITAHAPADGTLDITAMKGMIKRTNAVSGETVFFDMTAISGLNVVTAGGADNALNYLYCDYNAGAPTIKATTDRTTIHDYDHFTVGRVYLAGTDADITQSGTNIYNFYRRIHNRLVKKYGIDWASGSVVSESDTRKLAITAGAWYMGNTELSTAALDTNVTGSFSTYYYDFNTTSWVKTDSVTQLGNTQYNLTTSGDGLATMTANKYANYWVYQCMEGDLYVLYGQAQYNSLAEAQATQSPASVPDYISKDTRLCARITFLKSATNFTAVSNAHTTYIPSGVATNHNQLAGLQGGTTDEYYHLTNTQATDLTDSGDSSLHYHSADRNPANLSSTVPINKGGTATTTAPTDGKLLIGKTDGSYAVATVTQGTNVSITNGDGSITIACTEMTLADGKSVELKKALGTDHTWSGITATLTAHESTTRFQVGFINSSGEIALSDADAAATMPVRALATAAIDADATGVYLLRGYARDDSWSWTPGGALYASGTAGALTQTAPTGTGKVVQVLGYAMSATIIHFTPDVTYLELA